MEDPEAILAKMKAQMEGQNPMDLNIDDDFSELEKEVFGVKKNTKKKKKKNDDDLSLSDLEDEMEDKPEPKKRSKVKEIDDEDLLALEKEGLDDVSSDDDDDNNKKEEKKEIKKEVKKEIKKEEKIEIKKEEKKEIPKENVIDIYKEYTEKKYHNIDKMKCISVLQNELELCDNIIKFKIDNKFDDEDIWEGKKNLVKIKFNNYSTFVQEGSISMEEYFKIINEELEYEKKLLEFMNKDKNIQEFEKKELKNRINKRIELINAEIQQLKESMEGENEEENEEEKKEEEKKEEKKKVESNEKNIKLSKEDLENLEIIKERASEYMEALNYLKINDLPQERVINHLKKIHEEKKKIETGRGKEVEIFSLPLPLTPELIYGCSSAERFAKYKELIEGLTKEKNEIQKIMDDKINEMKKLPVAKQKKEMPKIKKELDNLKNKRIKYEQNIKSLTSDCQDKWIPAPFYKKEEETKRIEKTNSDIKENYIRIFIGKLSDYTNNKEVSIGVKLIVSKEYKDNIDFQKDYIYNKSIEWELEKSDFKHLYNREIRIKLRYKKFLMTHVEGIAFIKLSDLKNDINIKGEFKLDKECTQKNPPKIEVNIQVRNPCSGIAYEEISKIHFIIIKKYPSFKDKNAIKQNIETSNLNIEKKITQKENINLEKKNTPIQKGNTNNTEKKVIEKKEKKTIDENKTTNENKPKKNIPHIDKNKFKPEELEDPDIIDNLNCISVLEYKDKEYEGKIKKIEGRVPRTLRDKWNKIKVKINFLKNALGDTISPQAYLNIIENSLNHDKLLYQYFSQENNNDKANIVKVRVGLLLKEMKETQKFINENS